MPQNRYKVFFHFGQDLGLKTHASKGKAWIDASGLNIQGSTGSTAIPIADIREVEMFRLYGASRVIRVDYQGGRVFFAVVRFMIGQFASVNFFKTGKLHKMLADLASSNSETRLG
jgi:hypothetical protein